MFKRSQRHPNSHWAWWQALAASLFVFGLFGALPGFLPPISISAMKLGWFIGVPAVLAGVWSWWNFNWWPRIAFGVLLTLQILLAASRAWFLLIGITWVWLLPILLAYLLAWALPAIKPRVSAILWREQTAPQTRVGQIILVIALAIGPSAGVIGASLGMFGNRFGETDTVILVAAALMTSVAIGFAFAFAHQLWPDRPWAQKPVREN